MANEQNGHGGDLRRLAEHAGVPEDRILDFSANVNPLGFPEWLRPLISSRISSLVHYPQPEAYDFAMEVARLYGVPQENVIPGAGATELLGAISYASSGRKAVIPVPAYVDYMECAERAGLETVSVAMEEENGFALDIDLLENTISPGSLVFLGSPNNPNGAVAPADGLTQLALRHPDSLFVIDESFGGFVENFKTTATADQPENMVTVISFTKLFAIPGLRLGFAIAKPTLASTIRKHVYPWSVNSLAQAVGQRACLDTEFVERTKKATTGLRGELAAGLQKIPGLKIYPSEANYLLVRLDEGGAGLLAERLLARHKIAIRVCHNFRGLGDGYFRLAVRTNDDNRQLLAALHEEISIGASAAYLPKRRTPAIMFQGVSSSSGKSVLTAAFLRIMTQDGYRAAPFKAQNMALNSYVTLDGKEIGRAQVTQAQACGLEPDTRMNPVLLKPNSDTGSQVIMLGKPIGSMTAREYYRYKEEAFKTVKQAYDSLSSEFQVMALEGAGSCGEVNLKRYDIVNMAMAEYAGAKVLIVGDIDRGGVFASFAGIMETLAEWERRLVGGFVINKFRGDKSLLKDALDFTFSHCGRPTFGVVPYIHELGLPEEDQAVVHQYRKSWNGARVKVAVVRLRHVSNFTDFDPLSMEPDVELMAVTRPEELSGADVVILPGSKNVIGDLNVLKDSGVLQALKKMAMEGRGRLVGICGGFQMMGLEILDPQGIESASGRAEGLGLLAVSTRLEPEKTLKRTAGVHVESGIPVNGYEIHHGVTKGEGIHPAVTGDDGGLLGVMSPDGRHWGSYLHGIFHNGRFRRWFIDRLRTEKGEEPLGLQGAVYDVDQALDRLADGVRNSMDVDAVYKLMGIK